ncbi:MAG: hypothetical protein HDS99_04285 [Bacteroidales bacterium]|nr:hypothetical protein [Bacteroidales bacterium]
MNNIVNLSQLITRLAKTTDTDTTTARVFLRTFFQTIEQQLVAGESISIKGIGTFRRSSDPLVGAPEGVMFIPDEELQHEVNRRFEVFQPVELADGADAAILEPEQPNEPELSAEPEIPAEPVVPEVTSLPQNPVVEESPVSEEPAAVMPEVKPAEEPVVAPVAAPTVTPVVRPVEPVAEDETDDDDLARKNSRRNTIIWSIVIVFGIAIIGLALWKAISDNPIPEIGIDYDDEELVEPLDSTDDVTPLIEEVSIESLNSSEPVKSNQVTDTKEQPAPKVEAKPEPKADSSSEPVYDTVTSKNYLATMARKYYGADRYWVYIYEANKDKLRHPDRIAPGTKVLIPDKSTIPSIDNPAEARRLAEAKRKEIYARFK